MAEDRPDRPPPRIPYRPPGVVFIDGVFFVLTGCALFVLRRKRPHADRPLRVPGYPVVPLLFVVGEIGIVVGAFRNPEESAYGFDGEPKRHLYRVRFRQSDIWDDYGGAEHDTLDLEIFEHWLTGDAK